MNQDDIQKIMEELFALDPTLRAQEAQLAKLIPLIIAAKPNVPFTESFAAELKQKLQTMPASTGTAQRVGFFAKYFSLYQYSVGFAILALIIVLTIPLAIVRNNIVKQNNLDGDRLELATKKLALEPRAFGALGSNIADEAKKEMPSGAVDGNAAAPYAPAGSSATQNISAANSSDEEPGAAVPASAPTMSVEQIPQLAPAEPLKPPVAATGQKQHITKITAPAKIISVPVPPVAHYTYIGDALTLGDAQLAVFKRLKPQTYNDLNLFRNLNSSLLDVSTFSKLAIGNVHLVQNDDSGYTIDLDVQNGSASINQTYIAAPCESMICPLAADVQNNVQKQNNSKNADALELAAAFIQTHSINLAHYGAPRIENNNINIYNTLPSASIGQPNSAVALPAPTMRPVWFGSNISVLYPQMHNGEPVYEQGGNAAGMQIHVDVEKNKVSSLWNLQTQEYIASPYDAETNFDKIVKIAERGGINGMHYGGFEQITLGTPARVFMRWTKYNAGSSEDYLIPALAFPVSVVPLARSTKNVDLVMPWNGPQNIVVPLITDLLQN